MRESLYKFIFLLVLLFVAYLYNYHEIIQKRPESVHRWRQSDCASLALNYYQGGMKFFQPETHNLTSDGGTTSKACTSEIPVLYYTVAALYHLLGYNEIIFRILNTLIFFIGLYYLFRLFQYLIKDGVWSILLTIFLFTSPVLVYYANSFISNSGALAFSMAGWYYFVIYYHQRKMKYFYWMVVFLLLAASFKVSSLFSLFAIAGILLGEVSGLFHFKKRVFIKPMLQLGLLGLVVLVVFVWLLYASKYNSIHDCSYFSTTIFPIWNLDKESIIDVLNKIELIWLPHYYSSYAMLFLGAGTVLVIIFIKRNLKILNLALLLLLLQVIVYILLQFWTFADHDYYTIDIYVVPFVLLASVFLYFKGEVSKNFSLHNFQIRFYSFYSQ